MAWTASIWVALLVAASPPQVPPPPAPQAADPVDSADTARLNAQAVDTVAAQTASIRQSREEHTRAQAAFAQALAAYEEAKRRNDAERAEAAANAAAYQRDLAVWRTKVASGNAPDAGPRSGPDTATSKKKAARPAGVICTTETPTGSNMPQRVCRPG